MNSPVARSLTKGLTCGSPGQAGAGRAKGREPVSGLARPPDSPAQVVYLPHALLPRGLPAQARRRQGARVRAGHRPPLPRPQGNV
eukprot:7736720-Pyramimonas_sp.AAC.1